jgi:hypothetical protein
LSKLITGILSVFLIVGIMSVYVPNAHASNSAPPPPTVEICSGNIAAGQQGGSAAEGEIEQGQAGDTGAQSVSPEFNALTGNNLELQTQQNGECEPTLGQPPVGDTTRSNTP